MIVRLLVAALVLAVMSLASPEALAQGCAICRNSAAAGGEQAAKALNTGVLVLLLPTISIFVGILFYAARYRK